MLEQDYIDFTMKEIQKCKSKPYTMNNQELANEIFPFIKIVYPNAEMFVLGITQYIVISDKAKKALLKKLNAKKAEYQNFISEISMVIDSMN